MILIKRILALLISIISIFSCISIQTYAHEVFQGVSLRIQDRNSNSGPLLHVHYRYMRDNGAPAYYYDSAIYAINAWDGFANVTDGGCNQLAPTNMNVSFRISNNVWNDLGLSSSTLAITWIVDTNGLDLVYSNNVQNTSGVIDFSVIYMHPTGSIFNTGTSNTTTIKNRIRKTMVHEIGHAMGLGHPDRTGYNPISSSTYSIMRQGFPDNVKSGIVPQNHERTDLNNMY